MATYKSIQREIAELQKKAEILRKAEVAKAIAGIKAQIAEFGLTSTDLFGTVTGARAAAKAPARKTKSKLVAKYIDPVTKKTWNGYGRAPGWIKKGKLEDYLISSTPQAAVATPKAVAAKKTSPAKKTATKPVAKKALSAAAAKPAAAPAKKAVAAKKAASKPAAKKASSATAAKPASAPAKKTAPAPKAASKPAVKKTTAAKAKPARKAPAKQAASPKQPLPRPDSIPAGLEVGANQTSEPEASSVAPAAAPASGE